MDSIPMLTFSRYEGPGRKDLCAAVRLHMRNTLWGYDTRSLSVDQHTTLEHDLHWSCQLSGQVDHTFRAKLG